MVGRMSADTAPVSPMGEYMKSLPTSLPARLNVVQNLLRDTSELVGAFDETVHAYWDYANLHPFTPGRASRYAPGCEKTEEVAATLEERGVHGRWEVAGARSLDFVYLDREIVPAAGHTRRGVVKADVILATSGRRLIIGEIKTSTDTDAFGALLQGLHAAAQLAGPTQRARLRLWCSRSDFVVGEQIPDVYILLVNHPTRRKLQRQPEIERHVHRIEFLKIACSDNATTLGAFGTVVALGRRAGSRPIASGQFDPAAPAGIQALSAARGAERLGVASSRLTRLRRPPCLGRRRGPTAPKLPPGTTGTRGCRCGPGTGYAPP